MELIVSRLEIENRIFTVRGVQVMLDSHLAEMYAVEIKRLNEQVKRNIERFPESFRFQLTADEWEILRSQFATLENDPGLRSQFATLTDERGKHRKYRPYVFTEQGVAMLASVLNSPIEAEQRFEMVFKALENRNMQPNSGVIATIYTKQINKQMKLDIDRHNSQYESVEIKLIANTHDRFLIIDGVDLFHIGASLKDLGTKWFAFSKMNSLTQEVLSKLPGK